MDYLTHLKEDLLDFESKVEAILHYVSDEPPEIVIENLSLIKCLLSNSRSHLQLKTDQKSSQSKLNSNKNKGIESDLKVEVFDKPEAIICDKDDSFDNSTATVIILKDIKEEINVDNTDSLEDENQDDPENIEEDVLEPDSKFFKQNNPKKKLSQSKEYFQCDICTKKFTNEDSLLDHKDNFDHEELKCTFCSKYFPQNYFLERHLQKHTKIKLFCCDICGKTLSTKEYVAWHKENIHGIGKQKSDSFECQICGKSFPVERYLKTHIKLNHTVGKAFACDKCGSTFKKKQCLERHLMTHIEERPFTCDKCVKPKSFKTLSDLEQHKITHRSIKPFQCDICPSTMSRKKALKEHYRKMHNIQKKFCELEEVEEN